MTAGEAGLRDEPLMGGTPAMHFAVDADNYRQDVSPRGLGVALAFAVPLVWLGASATGRGWLGTDPLAVVLVTLLYIAVYANNVRLIRDGRLLSPRFWPFRVAGCVAAATFVGVFGATSSHEASSALLALPFLAMAIGIAVRPTHLMLPILLVPLLVLRLVFVPEVTSLSLGVLVCVSLASHLVFLRVARLIVRERQASSRLAAARDLLRDAEERAGQLRVAMSLHDSLSGALLATRRRLQLRHEDGAAGATETGGAEEGALDAARRWLLRLRRVIAGPIASHEESVVRALERMAAALEVPLELDAPLEGFESDPEERDDLLAILSELVANAAAHGQGDPLTVRLRADERGITLSCRMSAEHRSAERSSATPVLGRGLRNIRLRTLRHGGEVHLQDATLVVSWPRKPRLESVLWRAAAEVFLIVTSFCVLLLIIDRRIAPLVVGAIVGVFLVATIRDRFTRATRTEAELEAVRRARLGAEERMHLNLAEQALGPAVQSAEQALAARDAAGVRKAFDALALRLRDLMWVLEWKGDAKTLRADLAQLAQEAGRPPPERIPREAADDVALRWQLVAQLREPGMTGS